ncbi:MAG: TetR/AcrR family transcriptional regulator [Gammaproteobacteria bacterium]|nr:TetR/AcrR family transcriptional regulator [Gammaproteobacteria bacterium]
MSVPKPKTGAARTYGGVSGEQRAAERRRRFIEAGIETFGRVGYHAATVRGICRRAGLTDRYFYESFKNTEDLLCAAYVQVVVAMRDRILHAAMSAPRTPEAMARAGLTAYFETMRDRRLARLTLSEVLGVSPRANQVYTHHTHLFTSQLMAAIKQVHPELKLDGQDDEIVGTALVGAWAQVATRWLLQGYAYPLERLVDHCATVLMATIDRLAARTVALPGPA